MEKNKKPAGRLKGILPFLLLFGPASLLIFLGTRGCDHVFKTLDDYGQAINYSFTDLKGKKRTAKDFKDEIIIITTIQETCPDSCAVSLFHLDQGLYQHIRQNKTKQFKHIRIISFVTDGFGKSVDDLSVAEKILQDQVEGYDPETWILAKGESKKIYDFENNNETLLKTGKEYFGGESFQELILLLDKQNHLRMVLSGKSEGMVRRMNQSVALLQKQYDKERAKSK